MQTQIALERVRMEKISAAIHKLFDREASLINHEQDLSYFSQQLKPAKMKIYSRAEREAAQLTDL